MRSPHRHEWFWTALLIVTLAIMVGVTVWPWIAAL